MVREVCSPDVGRMGIEILRYIPFDNLSIFYDMLEVCFMEFCDLEVMICDGVHMFYCKLVSFFTQDAFLYVYL